MFPILTRTILLAGVLALTQGCSKSDGSSSDDSCLDDTSGEKGPAPYRLTCIKVSSWLDIRTWEVRTSACDESPACPTGFEPTVCSYEEFGCANETMECGNSYCEDGETKTSCPMDCDVQAMPYTASSHEMIEVDGIERTWS